ncbi:MAG: hypothetical protein EA379_05850 [Phycisphaerales bacterium]|nr:MAG: hypothetical protein EA379_05850 [Phycisphaerales bacterium]
MKTADANRPIRVLSLGALGALSGALLVALVSGASGRQPAPPITEALAGPGMSVLPRLIYMGNPTCTGSACHSADSPSDIAGRMIGDEFNIWSDSDPHANAFRSLSDDLSKQIAERLSIPDATVSGRCLTCHTMPVPEPQRGERFDVRNAVGCEACHGPGEKYLEPHTAEGWYGRQRETLDARGFLDTWGVIDTTNISVRATMCTACHLNIDRDLLDAGHPPLKFEMFGYDNYVFDEGFRRHWSNPKGKMFDARLWAVGQAVALQAAKAQRDSWKAKGWDVADAEALIRIYEQGVQIVRTHFGSDVPGALDRAEITPAKAGAAAKDLAALAAGASTPLHMEVLAYGVGALVAACYDAKGAELDDNFYDAFFDALDAAADGDAGAFKDSAAALAALAT